MEESKKRLSFAAVYKQSDDSGGVNPQVQFDELAPLYALYLGTAGLPSNPQELDYLEVAAENLEIPYGVWTGSSLRVSRFSGDGRVIVKVVHIDLPPAVARFFHHLDDFLMGLDLEKPGGQVIIEARQALEKVWEEETGSIDSFHHLLLSVIATAAGKFQLPLTIPLS